MLTACSNCLNGGVRPWEYAAAIVAGALALGALVVFGRIALTTEGRRGIAAGVAALGLGLAPLFALALLQSSARPRDPAPNLICGSALDASRLEGWPTDAALDESQTTCKVAAEARVDQATAVAAVGLAVGLPAGAIALVGRRHRAGSVAPLPREATTTAP